MRGTIAFLLALSSLFAQDTLKHARELYERTDYKASLAVLADIAKPMGEDYCLIGQNHFMLGDYKKATDAFQKARALEPGNSEYAHWLGRSFGRRAETSNILTAPMHASKARQFFEEAVALDPSNEEALNDLFDYYLEAPGMLGGGFDKAEQVAKRIAARNPAEGHFAAAQLADKRKQYDSAEQHLRKAMELAPRQVGRVIDLAKYLAKRGRLEESEAVFNHAEEVEPNSPKVCFARARVYVEEKRNLDRAKSLLIKYLQSDLTPDDPPKEQAEKLLKQVSGV